MHPPRHALGALLLEQGHYEEAENVYRADLGLNNEIIRCAQHRGNIWSLHGLTEILKLKGDSDEFTQVFNQYQLAKKKSDQTILSSCYCRKSVTPHIGKDPRS